MNSWKTTVAGALVIVAALATAGSALLDGDPDTVIDMQLLLETVIAGAVAAGLIAARDNNVTSEESGAKELSRQKHHTRLPVVLLCFSMSAMMGCATMKSVTINDDGSSHSTKVVVPPFSKQKLADFRYEAGVDSDGAWRQSIGSTGEEIDNTGQAEVAIAISAAVGSAVQAAIQASTIVPPPSPLIQALPHVADIIEAIP